MKGSEINNVSCFKRLFFTKMQHISAYNDLMNKSFITDLASTWNGQICARAEDLWLYPCTHSTIHSSPRHLPLHCPLQLESPLALPVSSSPPSDPAPAGCLLPCTTALQEALAPWFTRAVPGQHFHPCLTQPFTSSACRSMYPSGLQCQGAGKMNNAAKQSFSFFKIMSQGWGLGFLVIYSPFG